jgi:1,4-dihydroxy-2-naphthoate octaprenyltransferase
MLKLKTHLWTLPRWFAAPFFGGPVVLGALLAGGPNASSWLGLAAALLVMAGGHSFNSLLDYSWTGLDRGDVASRSAEKAYTGGQSVIARGIVSPKEVALNASLWYLLALAPLVYLALNVGWRALLIGLLGMSVTFFYARSKFNWTHETVLGAATGPISVLAGMFATSPSPPWVTGLIVSVPAAILPAFAGLALDEWPDAEANLKKGVRSLAYKVWENGVALEWYLSSWFLFMYLYQLFLITTGRLAQMTAITLLCWPFFIASMVMLKADFKKWAGLMAMVGLSYPVLLAVGQYLGG